MTQSTSARNPIPRTMSIGAIAAGNIALAWLCGYLALENIAIFMANPAAGPEPTAFNWFYLFLSGVTPVLLVVAALCLGIGFVRRYSAVWHVAWVVQRILYWAFLLRSIAQILPSFFMPNEGLHGLMSLVGGIFWLVPTAIALAGTLYLGWLANRKTTALPHRAG